MRAREKQILSVNLKDDPTEKNDVAAEHPDMVKKMEQIAKAARTSNVMFPLTYEECRKAAPRGVLPKARGKAGKAGEAEAAQPEAPK